MLNKRPIAPSGSINNAVPVKQRRFYSEEESQVNFSASESIKQSSKLTKQETVLNRFLQSPQAEDFQHGQMSTRKKPFYFPCDTTVIRQYHLTGIDIGDPKKLRCSLSIGNDGQYKSHIIHRMKVIAECPGVIHYRQASTNETTDIPRVHRINHWGATMVRFATLRHGPLLLFPIQQESVDLVKTLRNKDTNDFEMEGRIEFETEEIKMENTESEFGCKFTRDLGLPFSNDDVENAPLHVNHFPIFAFTENGGITVELEFATMEELFSVKDGSTPHKSIDRQLLKGDDIKFTLEVHCHEISESYRIYLMDEFRHKDGKDYKVLQNILGKSLKIKTHPEVTSSFDQHYKTRQSISSIEENNVKSSSVSLVANVSEENSLSVSSNKTQVTEIPCGFGQRFDLNDDYIQVNLTNAVQCPVRAIIVTFQAQTHIDKGDYREYGWGDFRELKDPIELLGLCYDHEYVGGKMKDAVACRRQYVRDHTIHNNVAGNFIYLLPLCEKIDDYRLNGFHMLNQHGDVRVIIKKSHEVTNGILNVWLMCEDLITVKYDLITKKITAGSYFLNNTMRQ